MQSVEAAITLILILWVYLNATKFLENYSYWTLRLRLSVIEPWIITPLIILLWVTIGQAVVFRLSTPFDSFRFLIGLICSAGAFVSFLGYVWPAHQIRGYLRIRWKAWAGPSRTGIRPELVPYIGGRRDWETLEKLSRNTSTLHPSDRFSGNYILSRRLIVSDPTGLLLKRSEVDKKENVLWVPQSSVRVGVFQPIVPGEPASLLWGEFNGFYRRCSRAIISIPRHLLSPWPKLACGVDAHGLCLACGILGRNKGLRPSSFICNLQIKSLIGDFEQNSVFWPRPSKTLRSLFHRECDYYFSSLGETFVTVATELALLLNDAPTEVVEDWLDARLEHQDLELNNEAHALGASQQELDLLYRGHYATMLVSLSAHCIGVRIRPEMLVYHAVCTSVGASPGVWSTLTNMEERRQQELEALGQRVLPLINAII